MESLLNELAEETEGRDSYFRHLYRYKVRNR